MRKQQAQVKGMAVFLAGLSLWGPLTAQVDYGSQIQPIFSQNCAFAGCHVSGHSTGLDLSEGKSYGLLVDVVSAGYAPALRVDPFDADSSVLWHKVAGTGQYGDRMPLGGPALHQDQIDLIETWINEGAPEMLLAAGGGETLPGHFKIEGNFPNPFNVRTVLTLQASGKTRARASIVDLKGRVVKDFGTVLLREGRTHFTWDGRNGASLEAATGVYVFRLSTETVALSHKMLLMK